MKNPALIFSLLKRFVGIIFFFFFYLCYGLMVKLAADSSLSALERIIYPSLVYLISWIFVILGIYLAGPEIVDKIKVFFVYVKNKFLRKKSDQ